MLVRWVILGISFVLFSDLVFAEEVFTYPNRVDFESQMRALGEGKGGYQYVLPLKYLDVQSAVSTLQGLYPEAVFVGDARSRAVGMSGDEFTYRAVRKVLGKLDVALRQIRFDVKILEVNYFKFEEYKQFFSELTSGFQVNYDFDSRKLFSAGPVEAQLNQLTQEGRASVLAKPSVVSLDNHEARIHVGDRIPYSVEKVYNGGLSSEVHYLDTGIVLEILPRISSGDRVVVDIQASISSVKQWREFSRSSYPVLASRETSTIVEIPDRGTLVMAGLFDSSVRKNKSGVPFLSKIPILGVPFRSRSAQRQQSDIIFLITPYIY